MSFEQDCKDFKGLEGFRLRLIVLKMKEINSF